MHDDVRRICSEAYLEYVRSLRSNAETLHEEIEMLKNTMALTGVQYSESVTTSTKGDALESSVIELHELIAKFCDEHRAFVSEVEQAHEMLEQLPKQEYTDALKLYYLCGWTWKRTYEKLHYSESGMKKIRKAALIALYDYIPEEWKRILPKAL